MLRLTPETPVKPIHRQKFYDSCSKLHFSQWMGSLAVSFSSHALYFVVPTARIWDFCHAMWKFLVQCSHVRIHRGKRKFFIWSHWRHLQKHRKLQISDYLALLSFVFYFSVIWHTKRKKRGLLRHICNTIWCSHMLKAALRDPFSIC